MARNSSSVRIIAGRWRRRRVPVAAVPGLRPTPDRVRETLFSWLAARVQGARCLDLYAGTGSLGLEAASRGAATVVMVERHRGAARALETVVASLGAGGVRVVCADALAWLRGPGEPQDLVFVDPPFDAPSYAEVARLLAAGGWLAPDARVYLESRLDAGDLGLGEGWRVLRSNKAGRVRYHLASWTPPGGEPAHSAAREQP